MRGATTGIHRLHRSEFACGNGPHNGSGFRFPGSNDGLNTGRSSLFASYLPRSGCQFRINVMGVVVESSTCVLIKNRPSRETEY